MTKRKTGKKTDPPRRKPGRPTTIDAAATVVIKMPNALADAIDAWAAASGVTRSEAARRLIEAGLAAKLKPRK